MSESPPPRKRRDLRLPVALAVTAGIVAGGFFLNQLPGRAIRATTEQVFPALSRVPAQRQEERAEAISPAEGTGALPPKAQRALENAATQIQAREFDRAIGILNTAQPLLKSEPRAFLLLGQALEGKKDFATARDFFMAAIDRNPYMSDAYWGVATTSESLGDLQAALGAMRSYLHTEPDKDPERLKIAQARSALWEWEARLGRGPWGPTRGIPPGFTADDVKRDGRGVAIRMPVPGTEQPDGRLLAEIRHADKQKIFSRP